MSKNISNLSGRIGLKIIYFKKFLTDYKILLMMMVLKKLLMNTIWVFPTIHGAESFYEFFKDHHIEKKKLLFVM